MGTDHLKLGGYAPSMLGN